MLPILEDYLAIVKRFPANVPLDKRRRKLRHTLLMDWQAREYAPIPHWSMLHDFISAHPEMHFEQPFYQKAVTPCVE